MGFETLMSDLISERKGLDRFAERQRRGLKINPLGAPSVAHETIRDEYGKILFNKGAETGGTQVLRSVRPKTRPEKFAQGGPVMRGIGTLNETARNMHSRPDRLAPCVYGASTFWTLAGMTAACSVLTRLNLLTLADDGMFGSGVKPREMQLFASGGEAMGPPPTRGPDPQGIGYFNSSRTADLFI